MSEIRGKYKVGTTRKKVVLQMEPETRDKLQIISAHRRSTMSKTVEKLIDNEYENLLRNLKL